MGWKVFIKKLWFLWKTFHPNFFYLPIFHSGGGWWESKKCLAWPYANVRNSVKNWGELLHQGETQKWGFMMTNHQLWDFLQECKSHCPLKFWISLNKLCLDRNFGQGLICWQICFLVLVSGEMAQYNWNNVDQSLNHFHQKTNEVKLLTAWFEKSFSQKKAVW